MTKTATTTTEAPAITKRHLTAAQKLALKVHIRTPYFDAPDRDKEFEWNLTQITENIAARRAGGGLKQCAFVLIGDSGTGKSKLLEHFISQVPEFQPRLDGRDEHRSPVLWTEAPASCTTKSHAIALLAALGVKASNRSSEFHLYSVLKRVLKANEIECIVIDEMQHAIRGTKEATIKKVQDVFKSLLQIDDWPIHIIFAGTPDLARFLEGDRQLANRCRVMRLLPIRHDRPNNLKFVNGIIAKVVSETAEMEIGWSEAHKLPARLVRSACGAFGTMIQTIQEACFRAMDDDRLTVTLEDFAAVYKANTGCIKKDNIFTSANWETINPAKSISDLTDEQ